MWALYRGWPVWVNGPWGQGPHTPETVTSPQPARPGPRYPVAMIYIYSAPDGRRRCLSREKLPGLALDFVQAFPDKEEDRAWELLRSLGDQLTNSN